MALDNNDQFVQQARAQGVSDTDIQTYLDSQQQMDQQGQQASQQANQQASQVTAGGDVNQPGAASNLAQGAASWVAQNPKTAASVVGVPLTGWGVYQGAKNLVQQGGQALGNALAQGRPAAPAPTGPVAPSTPGYSSTPSGIQVPNNVGGGPRPTPNIGNAEEMWNTLQKPAPAPTTPPVAPETPPIGAGAPATSAPGTAAAEGATGTAGDFMSRVAQMAGRYFPTVAKAGVGLTAAVMPGNVGQHYPWPSTGPSAGQEINPATRAPWTQAELAHYNARYGR